MSEYEQGLPWDMPSADKMVYEGIAAKSPEERSYLQHMAKRYIDLTAELIITRDALIRRANQAESERDQLREQRDALLIACRKALSLGSIGFQIGVAEMRGHEKIQEREGRRQDAIEAELRAAIQKAESSKIAQVEENL